VLCDNASVHEKYGAKDALRRMTHGRFAYIPEYSFRFSPIEGGFGNVWDFVRGYESQQQVIQCPRHIFHLGFGPIQ